MSGALRISRVEEQVKREVADILTRKVTDPAVAGVTVLRVKVSKDLSFADIYITALGDEERVARALVALERVRPYAQRLFAERVEFRKTPHLRFHVDKEYRAAERVFEILKGLERDKPSGEGSGPTNT